MAIPIKGYYKTTNITQEQLIDAIKMVKSQEKRIYELFKKFGKMTEHDVDEILYLIGKPILKVSLGRAMANLRKCGSIIEIGQIMGIHNHPVGLFELTDNPPVRPKKTRPKSCSFDFVYVNDDTIHLEQSIDNALKQMDIVINRNNIQTI